MARSLGEKQIKYRRNGSAEMNHRAPVLAIISETFPPDLCGVADYVQILATELANDFEVHVLTRSQGEVKQYRLDRVTVHEMMRSRFYIWDVIRCLKLIQPDIVDIQLSYSGASRFNQFNLLSLFNSGLIRLLIKSSLCCTVHELSSFLPSNSHLRQIYRQIRDYGHTRWFDYYFCVDRRYLGYFKTPRKIYLENFSNIPTLSHKQQVNSRTILYFGTIAQHKNIDRLLQIFQSLQLLEPTCQLFLVGGVVENYQAAFSQILSEFSQDAVQYLGRLDDGELQAVLYQCSYAIFPFPITDKNASVLAMLVNGLIVLAESHRTSVFSQNHPTIYQTEQLTPGFIQAVIHQTYGQPLTYPTSDQLIAHHLQQRRSVYDQLMDCPTIS